MTTKPDLRKFKAEFLLDKISARLQSDVLADGAIASRFDIGIKHPIRLTENLTVDRDDLFGAFRQVSDHASILSFLDQTGAPFKGRISIESDGTGIVEVNSLKIRFEYAALLSSNQSKRTETLKSALSRNTISIQENEYLITLIEKAEFTNDDFISAVTILASSPESFAERLSGRVEAQQVSKGDLLPEDIRHWEHLTVAPVNSSSLREYIDDELANERRRRLAEGSTRAFRFDALTYSAPALVPHAILRQYDADVVIAMLKEAINLEDHFALAGMFEICADWVTRDNRFAALGTKVLDRLFADMERLKTACGMFAAGFIITTAYLAEHERLRQKSVYWRRLSAAAHASLIVRTAGVTDIKQEELVSWALSLSATPYFMSILSDMATEPRWRPEWIDPLYLVADVFGRVDNAINQISAAKAPTEWLQRRDIAQAWIDGQKINPLTRYPAVLEGGRRTDHPALLESGPIADMYRGFSDNFSIDYFSRLIHLVYLFGFPSELTNDLLNVLDVVRRDTRGLDDSLIEEILAVSANIAVQMNNGPLANKIADICLEKATGIKERTTVFQCIFRLVECSCADSDRNSARKILARQLENLAFTLSRSNFMGDLLEALNVLKRVAPEIAPLLGRALAVVRLGFVSVA